MNIKFSLRFLALSLLGFFIVSCDSSKQLTTTNPPEADAPLAKSLLWEISGQGISQPSYLFGTIHIIDSDKYFLPKGTLEAIDNTDIMVFEIDMSEMEDMGAMAQIMMQAFMEDNTTIKDLVSPEDYQLISDHFSEMGMPFMMLERIKPMFLSVMGGDMDMEGMQSGAITSYELKFNEMAQSMNRETAGLETIEFQMGLFDSIPYTEQAAMLVETIKMGSSSNDQMEEMISKYLDQDIDGLASYISEEADDMSNFEDLLLVKRNENWIPQIRTLSSKRPAFYAVGAGHLGGPKGVIRLLRAEGFTVTAVNKEM